MRSCSFHLIITNLHICMFSTYDMISNFIPFCIPLLNTTSDFNLQCQCVSVKHQVKWHHCYVNDSL